MFLKMVMIAAMSFFASAAGSAVATSIQDPPLPPPGENSCELYFKWVVKVGQPGHFEADCRGICNNVLVPCKQWQSGGPTGRVCGCGGENIPTILVCQAEVQIDLQTGEITDYDCLACEGPPPLFAIQDCLDLFGPPPPADYQPCSCPN